MHIKQLFDISILQHDNGTKIKEKYQFFSNFGQIITSYKKQSEIKQGMHVFSDLALVSDEALVFSHTNDAGIHGCQP